MTEAWEEAGWGQGQCLVFLEDPLYKAPPHLRTPSARVMMRPTISRNMATDSSTVMTTMPPVRAIPNSIDSMLLPVSRENGEAFVSRRSP